MKSLTYLIYILSYEGAVLGGCWYAVFILNQSGWWFVVAALFSACAYGPMKWIHGVGKDD